MKKNILILLFVSFSLNIIAQSEFDKVSDCYFSKSKDGEKIKAEIHKFEKFLISKKILKNSTGKEYYELFKRVSYNGEETEFNYNFKDSIKNFRIESIEECDRINNNLLDNKQSTTYKLKEALSSLEYESNISPKIVSEKIIHILKPIDFNNYLQKLKTLLLVYNFNYSSSEDLSQNSKENLNINENTKFLLIEINENNQTYVNGLKSEINSAFDKRIIDFIKIENHIVELKTSTKTLYSTYFKMVNRLKELNLIVKKEFSVKRFGKGLNELNSVEKEKLENEYGIRIKT